MKKDVFIHIKGIQSGEDENDTTELFTQGLFYEKNGKHYLIYDESEATGYKDCRTTLKVEGSEKVTMRRSGPNRSELVLEKGVRHVGFYDTLAGDIQIGVFADHIQNDLTGDGGKVYFKYQLDVNSVFLSENEVYIDVKSE